MAEVGRIAGTTTYRNVARHEVETWAQTAAIRVDESLYFPGPDALWPGFGYLFAFKLLPITCSGGIP